jgi:hypothetical protein
MMIRTLTRSLHVFLFLIVSNAQASPPIGAVVQNWHYDPVTKQLSIHVVNISNKDITGYSMSVTVKYANGTSAFSEMTEDFLPLMASFDSEELRRQYGNGTFAAGTSRDQVVPQTQDVRDVSATVDVVAYADRTADVENSRAFDHLTAARKGMLLATQQADEVLKQALASPNPNAAAAKELTRLADVSKGRSGSLNAKDPESRMEFALRGLASRAETSDLTQLIKDGEARIAFYAPHTQLVKGGQQ